MNDTEPSRYWFPAKRYGWGWGLPARWEGWLTIFVFVVLTIVDAILFEPSTRPVEFLAGMCVLITVVLGICYLKGEPPAWRWGKS